MKVDFESHQEISAEFGALRNSFWGPEIGLGMPLSEYIDYFLYYREAPEEFAIKICTFVRGPT